METRAIIVDDDAGHQTLLKEYLAEFGIETEGFRDEKGVLSAVEKGFSDIVILDIILPGKDGFEILKEIRGGSTIPVIMLSARGDDTDRIVGLELGADDYLAKPFNPRELLARIKAVLRRYPVEGNRPGAGSSTNILSAGGLSLDRTRQILSKGEKSVELSAMEYKLLSALMGRPGLVLSRDKLMDIIHDGKIISFDRNIDVTISRVRTKVEQVSGFRDLIKTVRGRGYRFVEKP